MGWLRNCLARVLPKNRFVRNVVTLAGGTAAGQVIMAVAVPIATRLYSPDDYGILTVYSSVANLLLIMSAGRYELAVPVAKDDEAAVNVLALSAVFVGGMALLTTMAVLFAADAIAAAAKLPGHSFYLWFLPLSIVCGGMYQVLNYWAVRTKRFGDIAKTKLTQSVGSNVTTIGLGFLHAGPIGLLLGTCVSYSSGTATLARPLFQGYREQLSAISWKRMRELLYRYRRFPLMSAPAALLNSAAFCIPPILLSSFYGTHVAGLYGLAMRIVGMPSVLVGTAISQVYMGETAEAARKDRSAIYGIFRSVTKKTLKLGLLLIAFGCVSPFIFGFIFGREWQTAGLYCALLSVHAAAQLVVSPISTVATVVERQDLQVLGDLVRCVLVILACVIPHALHLPAIVAIGSYTVTMLVTYTGFYFMYRWIALNCGEPIEEAA